MRTDLPWNVAGIPPEAREAARAAARREGLPVGEWLTRRILRSFSDTNEEALPRMVDSWNIPSGPSRRDTEDMLEHVTRSESETNDLARRVEEHLRNVSRRLDAAERSQSENNRAMSRAAAEINVATREQSQAFDQLGSHVVSLSERLERVERRAGDSSMRDAVKGLHLGLSRLADQITQTANQSASQVSTLAHNLEQLAAGLGQTRQDTENISRALDQRLAAVERATESNAHGLERAIKTIEEHTNAGVSAQTASAIAKLEDEIAALESRQVDPGLDQRLNGIEQKLTSIVSRLDSEPSNNSAEDDIRQFSQRLDTIEKRHGAEVDEIRAAVGHATARLATVESNSNPFSGAAATDPFTAPPTQFEMPPFPDAAPPHVEAQDDAFASPPASPPPFEAQDDAFASAPASPPPLDPNPFANDGQFTPMPADPFTTEPTPPPSIDSYLNAARQSARAAAAQADAERLRGPLAAFSWSGKQSDDNTATEQKGTSRYLYPALIAAVLIVALTVGLTLLSRHTPSASQQTEAANAFKSGAGVPDTHGLITDTAGQADSDIASVPEGMPPSDATTEATQSVATAAPKPDATQQRSVPATSAKPVPAPAASEKSAPPAKAETSIKSQPTTALDRLTALANNGNPAAETIVGFRYLNGDGVTASPTQAANWLERAAEQGQAVAQGRLATMYAQGQGVTKDPVKAVRWYQASAAQGNRIAMHDLALAYHDGVGLNKDLSESVRWFLKAASLGVVDSQVNLAILYERGEGVPQSLLDAYKWYLIAAAQGDSDAKSRSLALQTQLSADDRAAAERAAAAFRAAKMDPRANAVPQLSDLNGN